MRVLVCSVWTLTAQIRCDVIHRHIQITQNHRQFGHLLRPETENKHRGDKINTTEIMTSKKHLKRSDKQCY